jgi:nucleoside diphosphate kinase
VILPERVLMKLYYGPTITEEIWRAIVQNMTSGPCEIGIVWGMNAMERLLRVCGDKTDPAECFWGTIRHTFGRQFPPIPIGEKYLYYRNVIHRPKKESELEENLTLLRQFFS